MAPKGLASIAAAAIVYAGVAGAITLHAAQDATTPPTSLANALPPDADGEYIFKNNCATCHGPDGKGSPQSVIGFAAPLPDFTDCPTNTVEPFGDWNFPRAFFTEKAFPESETVWTTAITTKGARAVGNQLVYEHRIRQRSQYEITIPLDFQQTSPSGGWVKGLGGGVTVWEPFAMFAKGLGANGFVQLHGGYMASSNRTNVENSTYLRQAWGYTYAQDHGFGRAWTPMTEVLWSKDRGGKSVVDVVPQMQVSLSKLQHILLSVGVSVPATQREGRHPQFLTYFLWDWFDGGLFQYWH